jgi:hypothetical protein
MRFGTWNIRSLYKASSLTAAATEFSRYQLHLLNVQGFGWDTVGTVRAGDYNIFYGKGNEVHQLGAEFSVHHNIVSAVKIPRSRVC